MSSVASTPVSGKPAAPPEYYCPECGSIDLQVAAITWLYLVQGDGELRTEPCTGTPKWDDDCGMVCDDCRHADQAIAFTNTDPQPGDDIAAAIDAEGGDV